MANTIITATLDILPDSFDHYEMSREIIEFVTSMGPDLIVTNMLHDGPGGGATETTFSGPIDQVMTLVNYMTDGDYTLDLDGFKSYETDYQL